MLVGISPLLNSVCPMAFSTYILFEENVYLFVLQPYAFDTAIIKFWMDAAYPVFEVHEPSSWADRSTKMKLNAPNNDCPPF